ncbi:hypothetical protein SARC_08504 [Sphaeroforma arctica JP610]|uniref:Uncharacterized protein n=1 Tax=Sphaeroforma arctica JP610 TaxID=667725 RepID=A0A0L0FQN6_9EUKA|nr:hypothetical protein SARC_08504 [Sphaeroforma arctica JP610]KNC79092.1 hypothetical protein SARC_08504 [Sphaeroforma arctica JP610]|eukprot:XP_014152994.1 hypothetical protein SARC_08504 [Sphaeroforma arctica JP610]
MVDKMSHQTDRMGSLANFDRFDKAGDSQYPTIWEYAETNNNDGELEQTNDFITQNESMDGEQQRFVTTIAEFARETSEPDHMPATRAVSYERVHPVKRPTAYTRHSVAQQRFVIDKQVLNEQQANTVCNDKGSGLQTHTLVFGLSSNASGRKFKLKQHPSKSSTKLTTLTNNRNPAASEKAVNKTLSRKCSAKSKAGIKCRPLVHLPPEPLIDKSSERNTDCDFEEAKNLQSEKSTHKSNKASASHTTQSKACEKESGDDDGNDNSAQDGMKGGNTSLASNPLADTVPSSLSLTMEEFLFENAQQVEQLEPTTNMSIEEFLRESKTGTQSVTH